MLNNILINSLDTINIVYLWVLLNKESNDYFKLFFSITICSSLVNVDEYLKLSFIISYVFVIMTIKIIYKKELRSVILQFFLVIFVQMVFQIVLSLILDKVINSDYILQISTELITLCTIITFSKLSLGKKIKFEKINKNICMQLIPLFGMDVVVFKLIIIYYNELILNNWVIVALIAIILVISQIVIYISIIKGVKENEKLKISKQYNSIEIETIQEIKKRQHDFVNYKNTIRGIVEVVDEPKIGEVIRNYIKDENVYDNKIDELIYIDNIVIKSIIYRSICRAEKNSINFKYKVFNNVLDDILSYNEISNLLNNLLNNAFEEVMKDDCIEKNIEIDILKEGEISHLIVKNQIAESNSIDLNEIFTMGYSTKDAGTRGFGLYNVKQIIASYKGRLQVKIEAKTIIFDIYFNSSLG